MIKSTTLKNIFLKTELKFYLHLSKEEQRLRLLKRPETPEDNWKFSTGDLKEHERWEDYISITMSN